MYLNLMCNLHDRHSNFLLSIPSVAVEPEMKRRRFALDPAKVSTAVSEAAAAASTSAPDDGHRFIEQFNADMMQQFLAHQVRDTQSYVVQSVLYL